jgi:hypothetical protein
MDPGAVSDGFTGIKNALVKCLFVLKWSWIHKGLYVFSRAKCIIYVKALLRCTSKMKCL